MWYTQGVPRYPLPQVWEPSVKVHWTFFATVFADSIAECFSLSLFKRGPEENARLAEEVYQHLNAHKADNPSMGEVSNYLDHHLQQFLHALLYQFYFLINSKQIQQLLTFTGWYFCAFWVLLLVESFFHALLDFSLYFILLFCLSWHFLAPEMALYRHVLLFSSCPHTSEEHYHTVLSWDSSLFFLYFTLLVCSSYLFFLL